MLLEQGKQVLTLQQYALSLSSEAGHNAYGLISDGDPNLLFVVSTRPGYYRLMPGPELGLLLFRGQVERASRKRCIPSLYRASFGGVEMRSIKRLFWTLKIKELDSILRKHPAQIELSGSTFEGLQFDYDYTSLAQHYGYPTGLLDFSRNRDVAMFFATCDFDNSQHRYIPLSSGTAAIYTINLREVIAQRGWSVLPLGGDALPRPVAQYAFAISLAQGEDLDEMPWAEKIVFQITLDESQKYFDLFKGGELLFPTNSFDSFIASLRENNTISLNSILLGIANNTLPQHPQGLDGILNEFKNAGYKVSESDPVVPDDIVCDAQKEWCANRTAFFGKARIRGCCGHYQEP